MLNGANNQYGRTAHAKQPYPLPSNENLAALRMYAIVPTGSRLEHFTSFEEIANKSDATIGTVASSYEVEGIRFVWENDFQAVPEKDVKGFLDYVQMRAEDRQVDVLEIYHENGSYHDRELRHQN